MNSFRVRIKKYREYLLLLFLPPYFLSIIGNLRDTQANTSADDGVMAHVVASLNPKIFADDQVANIFRFETSSSMMNWLPFLGKKFLDLDPQIFWYGFQFIQISLVPIAFYLVINKFVTTKAKAILITLIALNIRPQMLNLSFSGDLEWMPYAGWLSLGISLISLYYFFSDRSIAFVSLILIGCLIHPTFGIWTMLFALLTIYMAREVKKISSKELLIIALVATLSFLNLIRVYIFTEEELAREIPDAYLSSIFKNFHFNAINILQITFDEQRLLVGNLSSLIGLIIFAMCSRKEIINLLGVRSLILLNSILVVSGVGVLTQVIGVITKNPTLVRILGTRFTTLTSCVLLLFFLLVIFESKTMISKVRIIYVILILIFPGALILSIISAHYFYTNRQKMSKSIFRLNSTLIFVNLIFLGSTLISLFNGFRNSSYNFSNVLNLIADSHLFVRNYLLENVYQGFWPVLMLFAIAAALVLDKYNWSIVSSSKLRQTLFFLFTFMLAIALLSGRYSNSVERFTDREKEFVRVQEWAKDFTLESSRFYIQSNTTYDGWRNFTLRPRAYLITTPKPYAFYKTDLNFLEIYNARVLEFGAAPLAKPSFEFLKSNFRDLKIDYLVCDLNFPTGDSVLSYRNEFFKVIKF